MLIDINKSLKFSKINITYDYNKFINKELEKEFPDKETILKLFYGIKNKEANKFALHHFTVM